MPATPNREPAPPALAHDRVQQLAGEIARRAPRAVGTPRVRITTPHARSVYLSYVRLAGPRDDVLDYAASLVHRGATPTPTEGSGVELVAIEAETDEELTLLFATPLYSGE